MGTRKKKPGVARLEVELDTIQCLTGNVKIYRGKKPSTTVIEITYINYDDANLNKQKYED